MAIKLSSMPEGDLWELVDRDLHSQHRERIFRFDFSSIDCVSMKNVIKTYLWRNHKDGSLTLNTLRIKLNDLKHFSNFASKNTINSFLELTNNDVDRYLSYLKTMLLPSGKPASKNTQRLCLCALKSLIQWGHLHMPAEVPDKNIFTGNEYRGINKKLKINFIPDAVVEQISHALPNEKNPYLRYGIIILQSTGMRIGDLLLLKTDCVRKHPISGDVMTWYDHKRRRWRTPLAIPSACTVAVKQLIERTAELREQAEESVKEYLFIYRPVRNRGAICRIMRSIYNVWLNGHKSNGRAISKGFVHNHNIQDTAGNVYSLSAHQFRRTLATDMLSRGLDLSVVQAALGHSSPNSTFRHYAMVKDAERMEVFKNIGIIGHVKVDSIIEDAAERTWFKENVNKRARMCDGYCTKPYADGQVCDRLLNRQKCYTCKKYITTPEFLDVHRSHLAVLEQQLEDNVYGDHYAEHFLPTIAILKEIIRRLEALQDA